MHFPTAVAFSILAAVSKGSAWSINIYDNVDNCNLKDNTKYQVLSGNESDCYTFGTPMPGVTCEQYTERGETKMDCSGLFKGQSVDMPGVKHCQFFGFDSCQSESIYGTRKACINTEDLLAGSGDYIRSFKCENAE
ncbi:hypothetical protein ACHAPO_008421 [Fusarium lateritium]